MLFTVNWSWSENVKSLGKHSVVTSEEDTVNRIYSLLKAEQKRLQIGELYFNAYQDDAVELDIEHELKPTYQNNAIEIVVCSREQLAKLRYPKSNPVLIVSITDAIAKFPPIPSTIPQYTLRRLAFDDIEANIDWFNDRKYTAFTPKLAETVATFIINRPINIKTIIFQCEAGISRSAAMAAATARYLGLDDMKYFKTPYLPNRLVYQLMVEQLRGE